MKLTSVLPLLLVVFGGCVSSQFSTTSWSAAQAPGEENVYPDHGNFKKAWASLKEDENREFLVLGLDIPQTAKTIETYETYNPGAIDSVFIRHSDTGQWIKVYSKPVDTDIAQQKRIFSIFLNETPFLVDAIRIAVNSPAVEGRNEIDAVAIKGQREE
jgi:hypothetical protein